jgi:hypothetical protein
MAPKIIDAYGSMHARDYWRMRGERTFPATVRFTAQLPIVPEPESDEQFLRDRDRGFKTWTDEDDNLRMVQGYPERNR